MASKEELRAYIDYSKKVEKILEESKDVAEVQKKIQELRKEHEERLNKLI
jgi:hypothetical protein